MSEIGFIGSGKLGLPVALAVESKGHNVTVYDINPAIKDYLDAGQIPFKEENLQPLLDKTSIKIAESIGEIVASSDLIFCAIQTPHSPEYEGTIRLPETRADFDYTFLTRAIGEVATQARLQDKQTTLAVISTCLPGTFSREIEPLLNDKIDYVYNPLYIAMGTVLEDYLNPEFNLIGVESNVAADQLERFYTTINDAPNLRTDITTAEGIKVSYNTWITAKTVLANAWGEMAHKTGMNFEDIRKAWELSTKRLISAKYIDSGLGDGGGCHPRDNIALSWLADEIGMSRNIWEDLMKAREDHMEFIADEALKYGEEITILGRAFKPETNIETGSPSILLANILTEKGALVRHYEDLEDADSVVVIGTKHQRYKDYKFRPGTVVIDPFRFIDDQEGVLVIRIGATITS